MPRQNTIMDRRAWFALILAVCALLSVPWAVAAGSGGGGSLPSTTYDQNKRALTPEQLSEKAFKAGIKQRDRALKQEAKATKAKSEKAANKALARAQKAYQKAIEKQGEALRLDPQNYRAANELGFALRKTGDFRKAVGAYNFALKVNPNFHEATEYRAEAFLALGLLEETKRSYMVLFREDRPLADQLMVSFKKWVEQQENPTTAEQEFATWVVEREKIAEISADLSWHTPRTRNWVHAPTAGG